MLHGTDCKSLTVTILFLIHERFMFRDVYIFWLFTFFTAWPLCDYQINDEARLSSLDRSNIPSALESNYRTVDLCKCIKSCTAFAKTFINTSVCKWSTN